MTSIQLAKKIAKSFYEGNIFDYSELGHRQELEYAKKRAETSVQYILNALDSATDLNFKPQAYTFYKDVLYQIKNLNNF